MDVTRSPFFLFKKHYKIFIIELVVWKAQYIACVFCLLSQFYNSFKP